MIRRTTLGAFGLGAFGLGAFGLAAAAAVCLLNTSRSATADDSKEKAVPPVLNFKMQSLDGKEINLAQYQGKVILVVNVASECGATPQYADLQTLYETYQDRGLVILGFPCNQFGSQEPGDAKEIREFCTQNYGVTFDLFAKIDVNGAKAAPLYKFLTSEETNPKFAGRIGWNFEKFLIGQDGQVVARFKTPVSPNDPQVIKAIETELAK